MDSQGMNEEFALRIFHVDHYMMKWTPELECWKLRGKFDGKGTRFPVLRIFGNTDKGAKCCLHVHGVLPYFYVPCPCDNPGQQFIDDLIADLNTELRTSFSTVDKRAPPMNYVYNMEIVSLIPFYGYHSAPSAFIKIFLYNPMLVTKAAYLCHNGKVGKIPMQPHEAHVPYALQFFMDYNLYGMDLIHVRRVKFRRAFVGLKNPGLKYIWRDEAQRRKAAGEAAPFEYTAASQGARSSQWKSGTSAMYMEILDEKLRCVEPTTPASTPASDQDETPNSSALAADALFGAISNFPQETDLQDSNQGLPSGSRRVVEFCGIFDPTDGHAYADVEEEADQNDEQAEMSQHLDDLLNGSTVLSLSKSQFPSISQVDGPPKVSCSYEWFQLESDEPDDCHLSSSDSDGSDIDEENMPTPSIRTGEQCLEIMDLTVASAAYKSQSKCLTQQKSMCSSSVISAHRERVFRIDFSTQSADDFKNRRMDRIFFSPDTTVDTSFGFDVTTVGLTNSQSVTCLTIMSVELFIKTREDLRPDPALDAIGAIFVCVHCTGSQKSLQAFCLFVADELAKSLAREHSLGNSFSQHCVDITADSELMLLEKFEQLVHQQDPDILIGFEMEMLSWGYLFDRADQLSYDLHTRCSRISNDRKRSRSFRAYSYITADVLSVTGRISINLWMLMRDAVTLRTYTFENVAFHVLRLRTPFYSFRQLTQWFASALNRWRVIEYYMLRTRANVELLVERDVVNRTAELARLIGIQFLEVLTRGSQFRIESMMLRMTKSAGYVAMSPTVEQRARMAAPECLALTLEPESNFFSHPVIVLDFQSLYPSICIAYNYCYSTCLGKVSNISGDGRMPFGCTRIPIRLEALKQLRSNITASPAGVLFVNSDVRRGIIPQMLEEILNTRIMVKKCVKEYTNEKDLLKVLDARQWGLKMIANLTYGYTAANFSGRMPCVEVADSIVQKGRETLENAIKMVNENPSWNAKVVYGDTDSMFVSVPDRSKEDAFRIGFEIAEKVTETNPYPVKLKFEKVYLPCVLQTKKRYVGYAYESLEQKDPIFDAKGIETVRRDSCPLVSDTLEDALKLLFDTNDVDVVERYLTKIFEKVLCDSISTEQFIFAKEYRGKHSYTENAPVPALAIARERLSKDRRSEPRVGERVPYVIVCGPPDATLISCVREPQQLVQDSSVRLNHAYYILRQLVPVINRMLIMFGRDANDLLSRFSNSLAIKQRKKRRRVFYEMEKTEQMSMSQFVKVNRCRVCWEVTSGGSFCADCLQRRRESYLTLEGRLRSSEEKLVKAIQMCRLCSEYTHSPDSSSVGCCSLSCPVYFQRLRLANAFFTASSDFNNFV